MILKIGYLILGLAVTFGVAFILLYSAITYSNYVHKKDIKRNRRDK